MTSFIILQRAILWRKGSGAEPLSRRTARAASSGWHIVLLVIATDGGSDTPLACHFAACAERLSKLNCGPAS